MSRIEAALRRAKTGFASPSPDEPDRPQAAQAENAQPGASPPEAAQPVPATREFRGFHPDHAEKLIVSPNIPQPLLETYRRLVATLHAYQAEHGIKVLMISSAVPDEGKTLTAANIALTLSESYERRVLLIDADLRRPSLDTLFGIGRVHGLNEAITSQPPRQVPVIQVSRHLSLLTAGRPDADPMSALTSARMRQLLAAWETLGLGGPRRDCAI